MNRRKSDFIKIAEWSIYIYILVVMLADSVGDLSVKIIRIVTSICLMIAILYSGKIRKSFYCGWTIVFLIYNILTISTAFYQRYAIDYTLSLSYVVIVNVLICQFEARHNILLNEAKFFVWSSIIKSGYIFLRYGMLVFLSSRSIENVSANSIGMYCAVAFSICIMIIMHIGNEKSTKKTNQYVYIGLAYLCLIFTILSASRKAIIYLLIPIVVYFFMKDKNVRKKITSAVVILILLFFSYYAIMKVDFIYNLVGNRVESMISGLEGNTTDSSTQTRLNLIEAGMTWFRKKPWLGYGMSNFKALNEYYRNSQYYAHNNYVELLVDCGIVGTAIYYSFYIVLLIKAWKNRKISKYNPIILGIIISFIIAEYGIVTYNDPIYQLILLSLWIFLDNQRRKSKERMDKN